MNNSENNNQMQISNEDLLRFLDTAPQFRSLREDRESSLTETPVSDCPRNESYFDLAVGDIVGSKADELLTHAATCARCSDLLARSLGALDGNPSREETAAIAELAAARTEWQEKLARELAATTAKKRPFRFPNRLGRWNRLVGGTAVAAALLLAAGAFLWQRRANTPEHQLAMAYEQSRTLELRIPEAPYAAMSAGGRTRGALADHEPPQLLDARARLARELERAPQDAHWLELQARADVLEERYSSATDVLDRLVAQGPVTADLLADAASAYYQRGLVSGSELDRSTALEYLRRADELAPTDPVILFNEAIVMEDRGQMMNAVEVWNRYITVERDPKWAAEGKRKLAALEQTLNRLKSHESRVDKMLATPQAMDALAADPQKLATLDEELSSYELGKMLPIAYPLAIDSSKDSQHVRGSPCSDMCLATRRLLKAIASSLETQHHDSWLTDLLSLDIETLPPATANIYAQALRAMGSAAHADDTGESIAAEGLAARAGNLFQQLNSSGKANPSLASAARAGAERSAAEYMIALQGQVKFRECREYALQLNAKSQEQPESSRHRWTETVKLITEKVCDDTPETRQAGRRLLLLASRMAESEKYRLLQARISMRQVDEAQDAGDDETAEQIAVATLRRLYDGDPPPFRITNTLSPLCYLEEDSPRPHVWVLCKSEEMGWLAQLGNHAIASLWRMDLARADIRVGAMQEARNQMRLAQEERTALGQGNPHLFTHPEIFLSNSLLEQGDLSEAEHYLDEAAAGLSSYSDSWGLRIYAEARGQLELARGRLENAARTLESEIRSSEGRNVHGGDRATAAEYAELDHDLYAELAATWLAQGRSQESVLALWERFRLRSRGLPITQCPAGALDCELPRVVEARRKLEDDILTGQIVLLDRVLVYRVDKSGVMWSTNPVRRKDVLDEAQTLERAVSSPFASLATTAKLSTRLSDALLPALPDDLAGNSSLLLEPDPMLQNLSWPILSTHAGPLGLRYPLAELRSLLVAEGNDHSRSQSDLEHSDRALVVGASVAAGDASPLPEALTEARNVNRFLKSPELLLGEQATNNHIAERIGSATIFHFAGHAVQTRSGTELLLAEDKPNQETPWVDGTFLRQHPPRACRLAVLSACSTGSREASWKQPLQDIVETLSSLGVPAVVATRWQIDSEASVPFMKAFYMSLSQGNSVAVALTSARRVQSGQSLYNNPYYWGAYYVTGKESNHMIGELNARSQESKEVWKRQVQRRGRPA